MIVFYDLSRRVFKLNFLCLVYGILTLAWVINDCPLPQVSNATTSAPDDTPIPLDQVKNSCRTNYGYPDSIDNAGPRLSHSPLALSLALLLLTALLAKSVWVTPLPPTRQSWDRQPLIVPWILIDGISSRRHWWVLQCIGVPMMCLLEQEELFVCFYQTLSITLNLCLLFVKSQLITLIIKYTLLTTVWLLQFS